MPKVLHFKRTSVTLSPVHIRFCKAEAKKRGHNNVSRVIQDLISDKMIKDSDSEPQEAKSC